MSSGSNSRAANGRTVKGIQGRLRLFLNRKKPVVATTVIRFQDFVTALQEIKSWPEYQATPLIALPSVARESGVAKVWYKDESHRFGLNSFKALGGAHAVLRVLQREVRKQLGNTPSSNQLRDGSLRRVTQHITVSTATDGIHGRTCAQG